MDRIWTFLDGKLSIASAIEDIIYPRAELGLMAWRRTNDSLAQSHNCTAIYLKDFHAKVEHPQNHTCNETLCSTVLLANNNNNNSNL